jgi:hypothetical protein
MESTATFQAGDSPLSIAQKYENTQIVEYIQEYIHRKSQHNTQFSKFPDRCYTLLRNEVEAMGPSYSKDEHLMKCCSSGDYAMVRFLVEEVGANPAFEKFISDDVASGSDMDGCDGIDLSVEERTGRVIQTPLLAAQSQNSLKIVSYLTQVIQSEHTMAKSPHRKRSNSGKPNSEKLFDFTSADERNTLPLTSSMLASTGINSQSPSQPMTPLMSVC